jgi:hypoxanthine phosphoribosyltransferase
MNEITSTAREEIRSLQGDDVIFVWGGVNDTGKNMKGALKYVTKFVNDNKDINIVLVNSPHRHDLIPASCVNKEVLKYNRQVKKVMKPQSNVKLLGDKIRQEPLH